MPRLLSDTGARLLGTLPPFLAGAFDMQGAMDAMAREIDRIDAEIENVRSNFWPQLGSDYLFLWESLLGVSVNPPDKTLDQRRNTLLAHLRNLGQTTSGLGWENAITDLVGTNWSYKEHDPADPASPPPYTIAITFPYAPGLTRPDMPNGFRSDGGAVGGDVYYAVTGVNTFGETLPSDVLHLNIDPAGTVNLDWSGAAGADSYNVYKGTDPDTLRRLANVPANAYVDDGSVGDSGLAPPATDTTQSFAAYEAVEFTRKITPAHIELEYFWGAGFILGVSQIGIDPL